MTKPKAKANPVEDVWTLDDYLGNKFTYGIYDELTDKDGENFELFKPLEFFRVFYLSVEEIEQDKAKPLAVSKLLKNDLYLYGDQKLTDKQRYFFYEKILDYYSNLRYEDEQIDICCREIMKLQENLDVYVEFEVGKASKKRDVFQEVLEHLETLPTHKEEIAYLIQKQTAYEQNKGLEFTFAGQKTFGEKCQLEINKREKLMRLETTPKQTASKDDIKKHEEARLDRVVLAMNYLLDCAGVSEDCQKSKKINFIDFVTPFSRNTIKNQLDNLHEKSDTDGVKYEEDMKIIRRYFQHLGLTEVVERIDRDLKF